MASMVPTAQHAQINLAAGLAQQSNRSSQPGGVVAVAQAAGSSNENKDGRVGVNQS